jgi:CTP:molybdopterin cytidylyltransferase MocA
MVRAIEGDPDCPMIDSLARAVEDKAIASRSGIIVQPIDAPFTTSAMIEKLSSEFRTTSRVLTHEGRPGHPVLVSRKLFLRITERGAGDLRALLEEEPAEQVEFPDPRILADLDTPEDVRRWSEPGD